MKERRRLTSALMVATLLALTLGSAVSARAQDAVKAPAGPTAIAAQEGDQAGPPRPPQERMGVAVLLAWVWLSIAVLIGILRLRVREADRVYRMGLGRKAGASPEDGGH